MTALAADRNTPYRDSEFFSYPVAAAKVIYKGALLVLDTSGNVEPCTTATGKIAVGRAEEYVDNSAGGAAAVNVKVRAGTFKWANGDSITKAEIGDTAYGVDDQTVAKAASGKSAVGTIVAVESDGVWVKTEVPWVTASTGLVAANNLSDVGSAATSRTNLGLGTGDAPTFLDLTITDDLVVTDDLTVSGKCDVAEALTGLQKTHVVAASAYTVTAADGDIVIFANANNDVVTLPAVAAENLGLRVTVVCLAADGTAKVSISPNAADAIFGTVASVSASGTDDKDWELTLATQNKGDYCVLVSDGSTGWAIVGGVGVWASEA